jgi:hypothetical protein
VLNCNTIILYSLPRTSFAVSRMYGFGSSIFLMRSLAFSDTLGHGSLSKVYTPRMIACAIPSSVSASSTVSQQQLHTHKGSLTGLDTQHVKV